MPSLQIGIWRDENRPILTACDDDNKHRILAYFISEEAAHDFAAMVDWGISTRVSSDRERSGHAMNTGTWEWLPIEQAPKDREILVCGGVWHCERGGKREVSGPIKVSFDDGSAYDYKALIPWVGQWIVSDSSGDAWVENPTHFCELPTPPEVG
jgi:hypothetical protein